MGRRRRFVNMSLTGKFMDWIKNRWRGRVQEFHIAPAREWRIFSAADVVDEQRPMQGYGKGGNACGKPHAEGHPPEAFKVKPAQEAKIFARVEFSRQ